MTRTFQPSFGAGELSPALWGRIDLAKYQVGLKRAKNVFIRPHGGIANRPGFQFVGEVKDSTYVPRLIEFQFNTIQTYILEFGNEYMRVIKNGGQVLEAGKTITAITKASPGVVTSAAHGFSNGDEVYISGVGGMTTLNGRNFRIASKTTDTFQLTDLYDEAIDTSALSAYTSGGTVAKIYELVTPYAAADVADLKFTQSADVMWLVHPSYEPRRLSRTGDASWTLTTETYGTSVSTPATPTVTRVNSDKTSTTLRYKITALNDDTGEESLASTAGSASGPLPSEWGTNDYMAITWSATSGASRYRIYKEDNDGSGTYGFIGYAVNTSFHDINITPDVSDSPPTTKTPFSGADNYPSCVTFYQQRLCYGATNNAPSTVWTSQTAAFKNFNISRPARATDSIQFTATSRKVNKIQSMVPMDGLLLMTSGAEFIVDAGANADAISPSSLRIRPQGYRGSASLEPIIIGDTVLFLQEKGCVIRDFGYQFATDGYTGNDLTVLAYHLFDGYQITAWAYAQSPRSIVWTVRDDGVLLSLTYMKEHDVFAWTQHDTQGSVEDVACISQDGADVPYFIVTRSINGQTKRYIERLASRSFEDVTDCNFLDCSLSYSGEAASTISGLYHLEGQAVVALADGNVVKNLTVANGEITLPNAAEKVVVGLSYTSEVRTMSIDFQTQGGTAQGRMKRVGKAVLRLEKTRGIWLGPTEAKLVEWKQRQSEPYDAPIGLFTGDMEQTFDADWNRDGDMWIKQFDPLPMTILAISPEIAGGN